MCGITASRVSVDPFWDPGDDAKHLGFILKIDVTAYQLQHALIVNQM